MIVYCCEGFVCVFLVIFFGELGGGLVEMFEILGF